MLDPRRMQRLIESDVFDAEAYPLLAYMNDVKAGVFSELAAGSAIDTYRRNLQRAYVERLEYLMTEELAATPGGGGGARTAVDISQSDIRPLARAQLKGILAEAARAEGRTQDLVTRAHLADLAARVRAILK